MNNQIIIRLAALIAIALPISAVSAESTKQRSKPSNISQKKESTPSIQETTDWLKEKFLAYGGGVMTQANITTKYDDIKFEGCSTSFVRTTILGPMPGSKGESGRFRSEISFSFADIDPQSITISYSSQNVNNISLKTNSNVPKVVVTETSSISRNAKTESKDGVSLTFRDNEISSRVVKALENMATLCSDKKEAF